MRFRDRVDAGRRLASRLASLRLERPVVVGLPRGGVPVAAEIATRLGAPLDVLIVRKLGHPLQPELGVGAIGEGDVTVLNRHLIEELGIGREALQKVTAAEERELTRRVALYRGGRPRVPLAGRTAVLVDDGLATGFTARAAIEVLRQAGADTVVLAVPVAPADTIHEMQQVADAVVCLATPGHFRAIGQWYDDFRQVGDDEVTRLLAAADPGAAPTPHPPAGEREVDVVAGNRHLAGTLVVPEGAHGIVLFAHGSGSSRLSPRNRLVAGTLNRAGIATLLFDLLTDPEAADRRNVFDVGLLGGRLVAATEWCREHRLPPHVGYFGASTGAAAALVAAATLGPDIRAVVSRGGRPDLAGDRLAAVRSPTLLIVGGRDGEVLELNRSAAARLVRCEHRLVVVPGATHLFEEPGTLESAADLAAEWFGVHVGPRRSAHPVRESSSHRDAGEVPETHPTSR